jgi:hypothetical protein
VVTDAKSTLQEGLYGGVMIDKASGTSGKSAIDGHA